MAKTKLEELVESLAKKADRNHEQMDSRLDNIEKVMITQDLTLKQQEINLKEHMKRSDNLEALYSDLQQKQIDPLKKHVNQVEGGLKLLGLISLLLGIASGLAKIFGIL